MEMLSIDNRQDGCAPNSEVAPRLGCNLMDEALADFDSRSEIVVLDVGAASSSSVNFFSDKKAYLFFPDLYNCLLYTSPSPRD